LLVAGCVSHLGKVGTVISKLGRDREEPTSSKVRLQINKHTSNIKISKFVILASAGLW
jgi:serine/threonine protein phosphatase PrpC